LQALSLRGDFQHSKPGDFTSEDLVLLLDQVGSSQADAIHGWAERTHSLRISSMTLC
jgi:hypothetical protein